MPLPRRPAPPSSPAVPAASPPRPGRPLGGGGVRALAVVVAMGLGATACGDAGSTVDSQRAVVPSATDRCEDVEFPELQFGSHLLGDTDPPVPYSSRPPTSGWHISGSPPRGVHDDPLSEPAQVATLEVGGVVVTYNAIAEEDLDDLLAVAEGPMGDRLALTPYDGIAPGMVAFTSWGAVQRCDGVDVAALERYLEAYGNPITDKAG